MWESILPQSEEPTWTLVFHNVKIVRNGDTSPYLVEFKNRSASSIIDLTNLKTIVNLGSSAKPMKKWTHHTLKQKKANCIHMFSNALTVVATTRHSRTNDLTTSKALNRLSSNEWGITRELDKEPSLHCSSIYITYKWSVLQQCVYLMSIHHVSTLRPSCFLYVPWHHTFNLHCTCAHHVYTMRNPCPLMSSPNPNPF